MKPKRWYTEKNVFIIKMTNHESILEKSWYIGAEGVVNSVPPSRKNGYIIKFPRENAHCIANLPKGGGVLIHYKKLALN